MLSIFKYIPIKCMKLILADLHTLLILMFINNLLKITAGDGVYITSSGKETFCGEVLLPSRASRTYSRGGCESDDHNRHFVINRHRHTSSFSLPLHCLNLHRAIVEVVQYEGEK